VEHLAAVIGVYPYRCRKCDVRFLRHSKAVSETAAASGSSAEREIKKTRRAMALKRKQREVVLYGTAIILFLLFLYYMTRDRGGATDGNAAVPSPHHAARAFAAALYLPL
jgi:hypothetical protein